jgi:hypothetical protein
LFQKVGITHHVSCPHAHQQNGSAERKHRPIVEVGLALLANASMPLKYWDEAFLTATFLVNLLPRKVIKSETPCERLLQVVPNYDALRTFGCACWPNLRPYNTCKLAFRSKQCVFIGYSPLHRGVKCLDVSTGRIYISRDVVFDENVFPFAPLHPNAGAILRKEILLLREGVQNLDDHVSPIVPVTNVLQEGEVSEENPAENAAEITVNGAETNSGEEDENCSRHEEDSPRTLSTVLIDPEEDLRAPSEAGSASPMVSRAVPDPPIYYTRRRLRAPL